MYTQDDKCVESHLLRMKPKKHFKNKKDFAILIFSSLIRLDSA